MIGNPAYNSYAHITGLTKHSYIPVLIMHTALAAGAEIGGQRASVAAGGNAGGAASGNAGGAGMRGAGMWAEQRGWERAHQRSGVVSSAGGNAGVAAGRNAGRNADGESARESKEAA